MQAREARPQLAFVRRSQMQSVAARRRKVEAEVLTENWPGKAPGELDMAGELRLDDLVLEEMARRRRVLVREMAPQLEQAMLRKIEWSQMMKAGLLMLQLDPREFRLSVRTVVPLD